jgi:DNA-directed RNA polymerase specialized sigma24 family protein/CheY-like chemotaxis protein
MSIAKQIAAHLPYLRRFARALSGSQQSGDAYVVSTLEALIADPSSFPADMTPRAGLYRVFMRLWSSVSVNGQHTPEPAISPAQRNLNLLTPRSRQAFLLRTVEEFPVADVARIMDVDAAEVDRLVALAGREIAQQVATSVLIIEDEPIIAMDIESLVKDLGHSVVGIARTHSEAVKLTSETRPGLILADIQLADGSSGLEAVNEILKSFDLPVIFITAYPERLLTGDRPEPAFLIAKPYQTETVRASISQALFFSRKSALSAA